MSQVKYAKHRKCKPPHINRLVKARIIPLHKGKIDSEEADHILDAIQDPSAFLAKHKRKSGNNGDSIDYIRARAVREEFKAKREKVEYERLVGKLVYADQVKQATFKLARRIRDALMQIPARVAPIVAAEKNQHKVHQIIEGEVRKALEGLASVKRG